MPKLFYDVDSVGFAVFLAAFTGGIQIDCEQVNLMSHKTHSGEDFYQINPNGNVPCVVISEENIVLNETASVLQYFADQVPPGVLSCVPGALSHLVLQNILGFIGTELHPPLCTIHAIHMKKEAVEMEQTIQEELVEHLRAEVKRSLHYCNDHMMRDDCKFLVGDNFTVADAYLSTVLSWSPEVQIEISQFPRVQRYMSDMEALENISLARERAKENPEKVVGNTLFPR